MQLLHWPCISKIGLSAKNPVFSDNDFILLAMFISRCSFTFPHDLQISKIGTLLSWLPQHTVHAFNDSILWTRPLDTSLLRAL